MERKSRCGFQRTELLAFNKLESSITSVLEVHSSQFLAVGGLADLPGGITPTAVEKELEGTYPQFVVVTTNHACKSVTHKPKHTMS